MLVTSVVVAVALHVWLLSPILWFTQELQREGVSSE